MVTLVKHEWHHTDVQYALELDEDLLAEIYPEMSNEEVDSLLKEIENGNVDLEDVINEAENNGVELEWDHQYDDMWTMRKGGYDVTYEVGDENSWYTPDPEPEPTHKCTKCKWKGMSYNTETIYLKEDGSVIENYFESDENAESTKDVCPMCGSDTEMTEAGLKEEQRRKEWDAKFDALEDDIDLI